MDEDRILWLLDGREPTIEDYKLLVAFCEAATSELLWQIVSKKPNMHWIVRSSITKALHEKIQRERKEEISNRIWAKVENLLLKE